MDWGAEHLQIAIATYTVQPWRVDFALLLHCFLSLLCADDGTFLASCAQDKTIRFWHAAAVLRARAGVFETSGDAGTSADTNFDDGDDDGDDDDDGGNPHPGGQLSNDNDEPTIAPAANASGAVETAAKKPRKEQHASLLTGPRRCFHPLFFVRQR